MGLYRLDWADVCGRHLDRGAAQGTRRPFPMPGAKPKYPRDRTFTLHHVRIEVDLDFGHKTISGTSSLTLSPVTEGLDCIVLDAVELKIKAVRLSTGEALRFDTDDTTLTARLPAPLQPGQQTTLSVDYEATPRKGLYFIGPDEAYPNKPLQAWTQGEDQDSRYWFPCYDFPNQRATSEVIATVPEGFFALSNGRLAETRHDGRRRVRTYHWSQQQPHVTYLITLAAGEYVEVADQLDGVPVQYYVAPGREEDARRSLGNTPKMMKLFNDLTGQPYPWAKYAQITATDFIFGGMENTSATTLTENALLDQRAAIDYSSDPLVSHELAHQWFGDLLTCKDWSHAWLNESFATYFEALFTEHNLGVDEFRYEMYRNANLYFTEATGRYRRPIVTRVYDDPIELFDRHLYEKGSLVLHMLRYSLGDALFFRAIRHYVQKHRDGIVGTEELRRSIEEATGRTMEAFFEQWAYRAGHPDFKVECTWDDEARLAKVTVTQRQETDAEVPVFQMPVVIDFSGEGGARSFRVELTEKEHHFHFPLERKPLMMRFDPGNYLLKTLEEEMPKEMHLHRLAHDDDAIGRIRAARGLAKLGAPDCIEALKRAVMEDRFWGVQAEAAQALGTVKSKPAMRALLEALGVQHPKARRAVVQALGEFKDEAVADAMVRLLGEGDESYFVEAEAARTLGKTRSPRAFDALQKALDKDSYIEVIRTAVMDGLAALRDERGVASVREWAAYGKPEQVRGAALVAMAKLGEDKRDTWESIADYLRDPMLRVRLRAVEALENLGDMKAVAALEAQVPRELDGRAKRRMREGAAAIREGAKGKEEARKLREDMDKLTQENRDLRDRLDKLEARLGRDSAGRQDP